MNDTNMKKFLPFVFPLLSLLIVIFLVFRWYDQRTQRGSITPFADGIEITELENGQDVSLVNNSTANSVAMSVEDEESEIPVQGEIRFQEDEDEITFAVYAQMPEGNYEVWLKDPDSEAVRKAFVLEMKKGGYIGSASISKEVLPFEVLVTEAGLEVPEKVLLKGELTVEDCQGDDCLINIEDLVK
jgi:hypothetical protein